MMANPRVEIVDNHYDQKYVSLLESQKDKKLGQIWHV
jgi:hypothetical protein